MSAKVVIDKLETVLVPLRKLTAWNGNVRRTRSDNSIDVLAASIQAHGLLQSLVVRKTSKGKYSVVAGKRRLLALSRLAKSGVVAANFPVSCRVLPQQSDLTEISLAENVQQEPMHPADAFEAFRSLIDNGHSVADIAARFGISELSVRRRLALARVSPSLLQKYREGEITLELLQAFTISEDHAAQEQVWTQLHPWNRQPQVIRQLLSNDRISASDKRVRFVGLTTYESSGGVVKRDLFADEESGEGVYICDAALLNRLVNEKLETIAHDLAGKGWKWTDIQVEKNYRYLGQFRRVYAKPIPFSAEKQSELDELERERSEITYILDENDEEDQEDATAQSHYARLNELEQHIDAIRATQEYDYPEDMKASAGAVVSVGENGQPQIIYGLIRKEEEATVSADRGETTPTNGIAPAGTGKDEEKRSTYSAALIESLTSYKTAAIAAELAQNAHVALAAVVYTLAVKEFALDLRIYGTKTCLQISQSHPNLEQAADSPAVQFLGNQRAHWLAQLSGHPADLWAWCLAQSDQTLLQFLAFLSALAVNAIQAKHDMEAAGRAPHADALVAALEVDMSRWFHATAENFFDRISKANILEALRAAGKEASSIRQSMKKAELAKVAEHDLGETGWLPEPLRPSLDFRQRMRGYFTEEESYETDAEPGHA